MNGASRNTAWAYWVTGPLKGELRQEALQECGPGEALVRTLYSGISRGTEGLVQRGEVPPSEAAEMRAPFQGGDFPWPVKYGYCNVGVVERGPSAWQGRRVFCLYPHQTRYLVPVSALHPIPDAVPTRRAVLAANLETAINGLWDATPRLGDQILIIGAGVVGSLCAWLAARIPGCRVTLVDRNPRRAMIADGLGIEFALPEKVSAEADLVIHASGAPAGLELALQVAGIESTVLELSWYGTTPVTLPLGGAFHRRRLILRSSQVGQVAAAQRARWDHRRRLALALELLTDPWLDTLISAEDAFQDLPAVQTRLASHSGETLMHLIRYQEDDG